MNISAERMENDENERIQDHLQDDVIKEALASGLDLREYSKKVRWIRCLKSQCCEFE